MDNIIIRGGYDCPEKGITGVIEALKTVKPNSFIYVFTDASSKDTDLINEAFELIQIKQCQVIKKCIIVHNFNSFTNKLSI